jgi:cytochrome P450
MTPHYDPFSPEALEDPTGLYRELRDESPCHFIEARNTWAISRFQDLWDAHLDTRHFTTVHGTMPWDVMRGSRNVAVMLHQMDPPQHTQVQRAVLPWFGKDALERHRARVETFATALVDEAIERGEFDLVHDVAWPLSAQVTALICGLPHEDAAFIKELVEKSQERVPGVEGQTKEGAAALAQVVAYLIDHVKERRAAGFDGEGMTDAFGHLEIDGEPAGDDVAIALQMMMFVVGGSSQFPKGFGALAYRLFSHPDQRAEVAANPSLAVPAFIEALRIDNPTQMLGRTVAKATEIQGQRLEPGQGVLFLYASAGRDEREFDDPDRFDIHRNPERTISFGTGPHTCTGRGFGALQAEILTRVLLDRMPEYVIDTADLEILRTEYMRGWIALPARSS